VRAVLLQDIPDWIRDVFEQELVEAGISVAWAGSEEDGALAQIASGADVLLTARRRIGAELIRTPGLQMIQVQGSGTSRWRRPEVDSAHDPRCGPLPPQPVRRVLS
jgi:hypothetical protein